MDKKKEYFLLIDLVDGRKGIIWLAPLQQQ
jgi:hypothetical protein